MQAWLYVFRENIPRVFWTEDRPPIISKQSLLVSEETFAAAPLEYSRLVIRNPTEAFNEIEQVSMWLDIDSCFGNCCLCIADDETRREVH